jgi:hypothetical protein
VERTRTVFYEMPRPPRKEDIVTIHVAGETVTLFHGDASKPYKSPNLLATLPGLKQVQNLDPLEYGKLLFEGIIHHEGSPRYKKRPTATGYDHAKMLADEQAGGRLCIALQVEFGPPEYPAYKWEYLTDGRDDTPLAVFENAPLFQLYGAAREVEVKPLNVLFAISDPIDLVAEGLADLDEVMEQNIIKDVMDPLRDNGLADYKILVGSETGAVTLDAIKEALQEGYHALHLLAHGVYQKRRGQYALVLENANRRAEYVRTREMKDVLLGRDLHLIVLASCLSGKEDIGDALGALAPNLVGSVSPAVIAMQDYMPIEGAQIFTHRFYGDLARSGRVDMAMAATRQDLYTHERDSWLWGIPTLLMSTTDGQLFTSNEDREDVPPRPGYGTIPIKSYEELGGQDPTAKRAASAVEAEMHRYGYTDRAMMSTLRAAIAPSLASGPPESKPIAPKQDRSENSELLKLKLGVRLVAGDLEGYIQNNSGLELSDSTLRQIASALNSGKHIILIGPHGTGKTSLAQDICSYAQENGFAAGFVLTTATADWTTFDTVGGYVPTREQTLQFRPGVFLEAINAGKWLVIDEINRAEIDKAFGELFTVLSGQPVDLPYKVRDEIVRVLPPVKRTEDNQGQPRYWIPQDATSPYHYVIHPNWRIIGTMNVYDKSSLFQMSFAFMRRFAFVDVDLPPTRAYFRLVDNWLEKQGIPLQAKESKTGRRLLELDRLGLLQRKFRTLLDREKAVSSERNPLMEQRAVGPAIVKDMIEYIGDRFKLEGQPDDATQLSIMGEAFLLYVIPQLDGLDFDGIQDVYTHVKDYFGELSTQELGQILTRIRLLYPHIKNWKADEPGATRSPQD